MALPSIKSVLERAQLASPVQFDEWLKAWRVAAENGSAESLFAFMCRERGVAEDVFLQQLAATLGWAFLDLKKVTVEPAVRNKISTKVAFQFGALPISFENDCPGKASGASR